MSRGLGDVYKRQDFYHMFGFRYEDIDYTQDVDADIEIDGVVM